jgi:hypothetical protein
MFRIFKLPKRDADIGGGQSASPAKSPSVPGRRSENVSDDELLDPLATISKINGFTAVQDSSLTGCSLARYEQVGALPAS